ncbi:hypothetical protein [Halobaculum litoreum]|uniref:Uncharacterized protein n=1 Tax=Halobaculum litoreum TaxID=3031998 RepID=A0ABD5XW60_9EURY|nr:hypothetical protein [Halobaculum sp. DT92]
MGGFVELIGVLVDGEQVVVSDLPIATGEMSPNKFLPSESPVPIPSIQVAQSTDDTIDITARGEEYRVQQDEELTVGLKSKTVTSPGGDQFEVTPQVRVRNHGELTAHKFTGE